MNDSKENINEETTNSHNESIELGRFKTILSF